MDNNASLSNEPLLDIIDLLYKANNPDDLSHLLFKEISKHIQFDSAIITLINRQTLELQEEFCFSKAALTWSTLDSASPSFDPWLFGPLCLTQLNRALRQSDIVFTCHFPIVKSDIFYRHQPCRYAMGVIASCRSQPVTAIRFYRYQEGGTDFSIDDIKLLNRLAFHLANAVYFQHTQIAVEPLYETGLIVYGADDRLIYKNEAINIMLEGKTLDTVLQIAQSGNNWLKNGMELYRVKNVPLTPHSMLALLAKYEKREEISQINENNNLEGSTDQGISIISIEPFRHRRAIANRLKHIGLSQREIDVSLRVMRGLSNYNIAKELFIDETTVKDHLQHVYSKIKIKSRTELISKLLGLDIELANHVIL